MEDCCTRLNCTPILKGGVRVLISNENPEAQERLAPDEGLKDRVRVAVARCREATKMTQNIGRRQRFDYRR